MSPHNYTIVMKNLLILSLAISFMVACNAPTQVEDTSNDNNTSIPINKSPYDDQSTIAKSEKPIKVTIAQIVKDPAKYDGVMVQLTGQCVKINPDIMGKNWIHLRDGTGGADTNDLTVTTSETDP